jgi:hypothetical protein
MGTYICLGPTVFCLTLPPIGICCNLVEKIVLLSFNLGSETVYHHCCLHGIMKWSAALWAVAALTAAPHAMALTAKGMLGANRYSGALPNPTGVCNMYLIDGRSIFGELI